MAIEVSVVDGLPLSFSQPARHTSPRAASVSTTMSAIISCTSWKDAIGRPNCSRDFAYSTDASRMLVYRAGALKDAGKPSTTETSIAKLFATEAACWCADRAIQVHGGAGYVDDHPVERFYRDARVTTLYEGTSQIQKLIIGRAATGINALVPS